MITSFPRSERTSSIHFDVERKDERSATHEESSAGESDGQRKKAQQTCNVKHDDSDWRVANVWRYQWAEALLPVVYQHGIYSKVIIRTPTCPAVSHNCSLTVRSSKYMVLLRKSIPIVAWYVLSNVSYINLKPFVNGFSIPWCSNFKVQKRYSHLVIRLVLPTLWSPRRTILVRLGGEDEKSADTGCEAESDMTRTHYKLENLFNCGVTLSHVSTVPKGVTVNNVPCVQIP